MTNNDILKKLRVALMLRDDQIVEILELVDFRMSKGEIGNFFRTENHPNFVVCGDQVLRNFLNGLVIHLRGTRENPKNPTIVLQKHKSEIPLREKPKVEQKGIDKKTPYGNTKPKSKSKPKNLRPKIQVVENVKFNNGKPNKS